MRTKSRSLLSISDVILADSIRSLQNDLIVKFSQNRRTAS
jgi:hypothetical protein